MLVRRVSHVHVSERETAHRWPDGRLDDRAWEDCRFDAGVELLRAAGHDVPPTHAEAEAIRADSGLPPTGGSRPDDLARGVRRRYGVDLPAWIGGGPEVVAALRPGTA
ncbi:MAG TPA: hypothetical protein VNJ28_04620, partial [Candidatus Limnocylindrales bacterium]|nr:hypothetical protein [Candidatus Limnocylindrales bacterium]